MILFLTHYLSLQGQVKIEKEYYLEIKRNRNLPNIMRSLKEMKLRKK